MSTESDYLRALKATLGPKGWSQDPDILAPHLTEWRDKYFGHTPILLLPQTTAQVSEAVKICSQHGVPIMAQGGNTGLVGGNTPQGEVLLSTRRLKAVRAVNPAANMMIAEAGVTLEVAQQAAQTAGRKFPLNLASQGSCTIGGVISTNAGGVHVIKYGTTKALVTGVEAVLADGRIYNGLSGLKKDNTGYDLSRLFIGAEGTLGIVTAASLKLFERPQTVVRVCAGFNAIKEAMSLLARCQSPALAMFEIMPRIGVQAVIEYFAGHQDPFSAPYPWYGILDFEIYDGQSDDFITALINRAIDDGLVRDAVIAQSGAQAKALLGLRENMSAAQKHLGASIKHDISIPVDQVANFISRADAAALALIPHARPVAFGHLGDGNIHYNVTSPIGADSDVFLAHWDALQSVVHDIVDSLGGSISAEHGIGIMKKQELAARADPVKMALLRSVKSALDPDNIMNPRVLI